MWSVESVAAHEWSARTGPGKRRLQAKERTNARAAGCHPPGMAPSNKASGKKALYTAMVPRGNGSEMVTDAIARRPWWKLTPYHPVTAAGSDEGESSGAGGSDSGSSGTNEISFNLWWGCNAQPFDLTASGLTPNRKPRVLVNRFAHMAEICHKWRLAVNLKRYARAAGIELTSIAPHTFVLRAGATPQQQQTDRELLGFREQAVECARRGEGTMWIVKPGAKNRGFGIEVKENAKAVEAHLKKAKPGGTWVVQKYIERPFLIGGRKFDVRQYVLVTPDLRVWMYRDSYIRTSATAYDTADLSDRSAHLTNDYVQKHLDTYGTFEDANKLSFAEFQTALDATPLSDGRILSLWGDVWPQMQHCIRHTFSAAMPHLSVHRSCGCSFELYGLDFMLDCNGKAS